LNLDATPEQRMVTRHCDESGRAQEREQWYKSTIFR
jgi:hypothetical protein